MMIDMSLNRKARIEMGVLEVEMLLELGLVSSLFPKIL